MESLNLFIRSVFIDNLVLAYFLGLLTFLVASGNVRSARRMGVAVWLVLVVAMPVSWCISQYILAPGALRWLSEGFASRDFSYLSLPAFIAVIACLVQLMKMISTKCGRVQKNSSGAKFPFIGVNCAVLGAALFMQQKEFGNALIATIYGAGAGTGWLLSIICVAAIRERLVDKAIPAPLRGTGITLIIAALMGLAFMGITGIRP